MDLRTAILNVFPTGTLSANTTNTTRDNRQAAPNVVNTVKPVAARPPRQSKPELEAWKIDDLRALADRAESKDASAVDKEILRTFETVVGVRAADLDKPPKQATPTPTATNRPPRQSLVDRLRDERSRMKAQGYFAQADGLRTALKEIEAEIQQLEIEVGRASSPELRARALYNLEIYRAAYWQGRREYNQARSAAYAALSKMSKNRPTPEPVARPLTHYERIQAETAEAIAKREADLVERRKAEPAARKRRVELRLKAQEVRAVATTPAKTAPARKAKVERLRAAHYADFWGLPESVALELAGALR